jgi:hypothetical protein
MTDTNNFGKMHRLRSRLLKLCAGSNPIYLVIQAQFAVLC